MFEIDAYNAALGRWKVVSKFVRMLKLRRKVPDTLKCSCDRAVGCDVVARYVV